jgi:hypothetical protein
MRHRRRAAAEVAVEVTPDLTLGLDESRGWSCRRRAPATQADAEGACIPPD